MQNIIDENGDDGMFVNETKEQAMYVSYHAYTLLKSIHYTDEEIAKQFFCTVEDLDILKSSFE